MICPHCGYNNHEGARYCLGCSQKLPEFGPAPDSSKRGYPTREDLPPPPFSGDYSPRHPKDYPPRPAHGDYPPRPAHGDYPPGPPPGDYPPGPPPAGRYPKEPDFSLDLPKKKSGLKIGLIIGGSCLAAAAIVLAVLWGLGFFKKGRNTVDPYTITYYDDGGRLVSQQEFNKYHELITNKYTYDESSDSFETVTNYKYKYDDKNRTTKVSLYSDDKLALYEKYSYEDNKQIGKQFDSDDTQTGKSKSTLNDGGQVTELNYSDMNGGSKEKHTYKYDDDGYLLEHCTYYDDKLSYRDTFTYEYEDGRPKKGHEVYKYYDDEGETSTYEFDMEFSY